MNNIEEPLTLYSLNNMARNALSDAMPLRYWVTGELSEVREAATGHCYIELVQRDEATKEMVAKARGTIWARIYSLLRPYFLEQTGQPFTAGLKVLLQVTVSFHELYGFTLDVCDIEPAYTIGDIARQRQLIIKRLTEEGVIGLNKELPIPVLPQRIAVISSATAAGYGDFCDQLMNNKYGFVFYPRLFPSPMQGSRVEEGMIAALDRIAQHADCWDLANNCAQFPLPIITGIGHQRDESLLDIVAHTSAKTPTAAAELLIHTMLAGESQLTETMGCIVESIRQRLANEKTRIATITGQLPVKTALFMQEQHHRLNLCQRYLDAASPKHILALGYSITRVNGKAVRNASQIKPGDTVHTTFAEGELTTIAK